MRHRGVASPFDSNAWRPRSDTVSIGFATARGVRFVRRRGPRARAMAAPHVVDFRRRARVAAPRGGPCRSTIGGTVRIAPRPATGLEPAGRRGPGRPWRDASTTDAPPCSCACRCARPHVIDLFAAVCVQDRHGVARARVNGGAARTRRRIGFPSIGSAPPVAYRSGSRALRTGIRRTTGTRSLVPAARSACCVPSGSCVEVSPPAGRVLPRPARAFPRRRRVARAGAARACRRDGLACNCQGRALGLRYGVGEWRVASARAAGALKPARAGCPGPLACVPLVAPPASVERRVRLEVVVERIPQARHAGPPVGSHATAARQPAVGLAVPISAGTGAGRCDGAAGRRRSVPRSAARSQGRQPNEAPGGRLLGLFVRGGCGQAVETDPQRENRPRAENALRPCFTRPKGRFPIPFCPPLG